MLDYIVMQMRKINREKGYSLSEMRPQGIMVVIFMNTNIQFKMIIKTTMIPCVLFSMRKLTIRDKNACKQQWFMVFRFGLHKSG